MFERCPTCTSSYCPIPADGPVNAKVYCYGERPGMQEEFAARKALATSVVPDHLCFIGDAGAEFNQTYLGLAGLRRDEVRVGNTVLCGKDNNKKPTEAEVRACAEWHMRQELYEGKPRVVVLMGATACGLAPELDLDLDHGIPRRGKLFGWEGWIVAMFHPAAGLHQTSMMIYMLEDWSKLKDWLAHGTWQWPNGLQYSSNDDTISPL